MLSESLTSDSPPAHSSSSSSTDGASDSLDPRVPASKIGLLPFATILFFCVCGGPYGLEDIISAAFPLYSIIGIILVPFLFALPLGLMTAELSTMFPENGGYTVWVQRGLGNFWGFMEGYVSWINTVTDNALYPAMFSDYLFRLTGEVSNPLLAFVIRTVVRSGVLIFISALALSGLEMVGALATIFCVMVVLPFVALTLVGIPDISVSTWLATPPDGVSGVDWTLFLSILAWNYAGWDSVSTIAGQVKNPKRNFPVAMIGDIIGVLLVYLPPILIGVSVNTQYSDWEESTFIDVARTVGGHISLGDYKFYWLAVWVTICACVSALGIFNGTMITSSWALSVMSEPELLGWSPLSWVNRRGSPWIAVLINTLTVLVLLFFPFQLLVQLSIIPYFIAMILEVLSLINLRRTNPDMERPFKIPVGIPLLIVMFIPFFLMSGALMLSPLWNIVYSLFANGKFDWRDVLLISFNLFVIGVGVLVYMCRHWRATRSRIQRLRSRLFGGKWSVDDEEENLVEMDEIGRTPQHSSETSSSNEALEVHVIEESARHHDGIREGADRKSVV